MLFVLAGEAGDLPHYGDRGLNAGILLLSLERVRATGFSKERDMIIRHHHPRKELLLGEQDVLNVYDYRHPQNIHILPCTMNQRSDSACYDGFAIVLHGNRGLSTDEKYPYAYLYSAIAAAQRLYRLGSS